MATATVEKPIQKWVQEQLDKIDWNSDKPVRFISAVDPESSPYSSRDTGKKLIQNLEFISVSDVVTDDEGREVRIRYVASSDSILVSEQEARGHTHPDYGKTTQHRKSRADAITMTNGVLEIVPRGNRNKITYLLTTNQNASNPSRKKNSMPMFTVDDAVVKAKKEYNALKLVDKARALVLSLDGNYSRLQEVAKLLHKDTMASEEQLLLQLRAEAEKNPQLIISTISEEKAEVDLLVHKAMDLGILEFTGFAYKFAASDSTIKTFRGRQNPDVAFKALVTFLGTDEGNVHFLHLQKLVSDYEKSTKEKMAQAV